MKKILLISPFPPSQNPRLLKEYHALKDAGYSIKAIYADRDFWASEHEVPEGFRRVAGKIGSPLHFFSRIIHKLAKLILPFEFSYHRASIFLYLAAIRYKADLYIGHDLTALPIVVKAAKKNHSKCGFDAEDFHRNETSDDVNSFQYRAAIDIENRYIPQLKYLTAGSPLISEAYNKLYPTINPLTINNVFDRENTSSHRKGYNSNSKLQLFWFSQTIGTGRGIETVIKAMAKLKDAPVTLTLLGDVNEHTASYFRNLSKNNGLMDGQLILLPPVPPDQLLDIVSQYDVGMALEMHKPFNREICLTNKIFAYITSGLAIIASNTKAQSRLLEEAPNLGFTFENDNEENLSKIISIYLENTKVLELHQANACYFAEQKFNWQTESQKFIALIHSIL